MNIPVNIPKDPTKNLDRTEIAVALISLAFVLLLLCGRPATAQTQLTTPTPEAVKQQSTLPPMPNYIDLPTTPRNPVRTRTGRAPNFIPECRTDDAACIERRNRQKTGSSSDVDPDFVR